MVAPESARSGGRRSSRSLKPLVAALLLAFVQPARSLPVDGVVVGGSGSISQSANTLTVTQSTPKLALNWQGFGIAAGESVNFVQPNRSAVALNRVLGSEASAIYGQLSANGQVFLVNFNGILFGRGAQVNVGGLVASTLDLSAADFMAGKRTFAGTTGSGRIDNLGSLSAAEGGYIALLGGQVSNQGTISAQLGSVALAAGKRVSLDFAGDKLLSLQVEQGTLDGLVENGQLIAADGGQVILSTRAAGEVLSGVVNNTGIVQARGISSDHGVIRLSGDLVVNTGTLDASGNTGSNGGTISLAGRSLLQAGAIRADGNGLNGSGGAITLAAGGTLLQTAAGEISANASGQGGSIDLSGGSAAFVSGSVSANGQSGGRISVTAPQLTLAAATISADGTNNGGTLLIGGDAHGANPQIANAQTTIVNPFATLSAQGKQGKIVVWSDQDTRYYGSAATGAEGFIEVSGKASLTYGGKADAGLGGNVLLDPTNLIIDASAPSLFYVDLANPDPAAGEMHGSGGVVTLANGNIVVATPNDNFGAAKAGAVYLYNGSNGALISTLTGSNANDQVGYNGITALPVNGNFVIASSSWNNDGSSAFSGVGAATWGSGTVGVSGIVSSSNSLIGGTPYDRVGSGVTALTNGNYVVGSKFWKNGIYASAGAATWGDGTSGITGIVSSTNSLVGQYGYYYVGGKITALSNGNYVSSSPDWYNGGAPSAGAVTWGNGATGGPRTTGIVSSTNSLVGSNNYDQVGSTVTALSNGNFVVASPSWNNGATSYAGAVTWGNGLGGTTGAVSSANSLVGGNVGDSVGSDGVRALTNGNYVVATSGWKNGAISNAGAATWGNGATGGPRTTGLITSANSLVGGQSGDMVGYGGVTALSNGNYVVDSYNWKNDTLSHAGAVTWGDGSTGIIGLASTTNSLVGSRANDQVGYGGVIALALNGNYVVTTPYWVNGAVTSAGAVTWGEGASGATRTTGLVSSTNSLVGSQSNDRVGLNGVTALSNGNYVVASGAWNSTVANVGAVTWGEGASAATRTTGIVSSANSLVGSTADDQVGRLAAWQTGSGGVTALTNGNYVVESPLWTSGTTTTAGAVSWGNGTSGATRTTGIVTSTNSLVGKTTGDQVGSGGVVPLANGNYVVRSPNYDQGALVDVGAVWLVADPSNLVAMVNASPGSTTLSPAALAGAALAGSTVTLQASQNITVNSAVSVAGKLNLVAGNDLTLNAAITSSATGTALQLASQRFINNVGAGALTAANGRWLVWSATPGSDTRDGLAYDFKQYNATYGSTSAAQVSGNGFLYAAAPVITAALTGSVSKVYDATTSATLAAANYTSSGALDGDSVVFNNPSSGTYDTKNAAASGKDVAVAGVAIAGAGNGAASVYGYQLAATTIHGAVGAITPKDLSMSGLSVAASKVYDATTVAVVSGSAALAASEAPGAGTGADGKSYSGDAVVITGTATGTYNSKNVATASTVSYGGLTLSGSEAGNYHLLTQGPSAATITPRSLAVNGISASDKVYDTTISATLTGTAGVTALGSDVVSVTGTGSGVFANKSVGTAKAVSVTGYTLGGADAGNYSVVQPSGLSANITAASLVVSGISASNKVYDATTSAILTGTAGVTALGSDVVSVTGTGSGVFANKSVGTAKAVSVTGYTLGGTDAGNYSVVQPSGLSANITAASLVVSGISASDKVYDATTSATLTGTAGVTALGSDVVSVTGTGSGVFANKSVGTAKAVSVSGYTLSGADAGNYSVVQPAGVTATISARPLTLSYGGINKAYDGTVAATVTTVDDRLGSDALTIARSAAFVDPNVGLAKLVNVSGVSLSGVAASNYALISTTGTTSADITAVAHPPDPPMPPDPPAPSGPSGPQPAPAMPSATGEFVGALSSLSRLPPSTLRACGETEAAGIKGACDPGTHAPSVGGPLVILRNGMDLPAMLSPESLRAD